VHLREFEMVCSCYAIAGMIPETFRWKFFPFSLIDRGKQWYLNNVVAAQGSWAKLVAEFCHMFFPAPRIAALRRDSLSFQQGERESLSTA
jgi:hypothetical protein